MRAWGRWNLHFVFQSRPDDSAVSLLRDEVRLCFVWSEFMARLELWWSSNAGLSGDRKVDFGEEACFSEIAVTCTVDDDEDGTLDCLRTVLCW